MYRFYQVGFFILLILLIAAFGYMLWNDNKKEQSNLTNQQQISKVSDEKSDLQVNFDATLNRLDSVQGVNDELLIKLQKISPKDTIIKKLSEPQKRMLRLIDSTNLLRDSLTMVGSVVADLLATPQLPQEQKNILNTTFSVLGNISLTLNFALDNKRLGILRDNAVSLKGLTSNFDKRIEKLNKFAKLLESFSKYLGVAIDVFSAAASQGIIVPKAAHVVAQ